MSRNNEPLPPGYHSHYGNTDPFAGKTIEYAYWTHVTVLRKTIAFFNTPEGTAIEHFLSGLRSRAMTLTPLCCAGCSAPWVDPVYPAVVITATPREDRDKQPVAVMASGLCRDCAVLGEEKAISGMIEPLRQLGIREKKGYTLVPDAGAPYPTTAEILGEQLQ